MVGVALLLVIGGFVSFAGSQSSTPAGTPPTATSVPSPSTAVMPADTQCGAETGSTVTVPDPSENFTPVAACWGVVCNSNADCAPCCQADDFVVWKCGPNHHCLCGQV